MKAWRDAAVVLLAKAGAMGIALATGFRAVSDDDFARVVIAEEWARAPRLDPSGTSWLPAPFVITGGLMKVFGRSLDVARAGAVGLGLLSALIVYRAAQWMGLGRAALGGAVVAAVLPWSARLGVATVPELLAAALTLLAIAALVPHPNEALDRRRIWGGAALLLATLSRYEAWPVAALFAGACLLDGLRDRSARAACWLGGATALLGPALWLVNNRVRHGDALHFLARVTAYRQALGTAEPGGAARLLEYPAAMVREEPEVFALLAAGLLVFAARRGAGELGGRLRPLARPAAVVLAQVAALALAMVRDGAPTHHPERAVLTALLLAAITAGALAWEVAAHTGRRAIDLVALGGAIALAAGLGRSRLPREGGAARSDEVAIGAAAAAAIPAGDPILVEVEDYGYLAILAALGRPEDAVPDRSIDPRAPRVPSSFRDPAALARRLAEAGPRAIIARKAAPATASLGEPLSTRGIFAVWRTPSGLPSSTPR